MDTRIIPDFNKMGGAGSPWINPPNGPPLRTGATPYNLKVCGGGVNLPMNVRKNDAKTALSIGALDLKREPDVYQDCNDPPRTAY